MKWEEDTEEGEGGEGGEEGEGGEGREGGEETEGGDDRNKQFYSRGSCITSKTKDALLLIQTK